MHTGSSVRIENSVTRIIVWHHTASLVIPNSYPRDGIFNPHLRTFKDSYSFILVLSAKIQLVAMLVDRLCVHVLKLHVLPLFLLVLEEGCTL